MANNNGNTQDFGVSLAHFCLRFRWLIIAATILAVVLLSTGLSRLQFSNTYRLFFSEVNPELQVFDEFLDTFSTTDTVLFVIHNPNGPALNIDTAATIEQMTEKAWKLPYSSRVDSITNFQNTYGEDDDLVVENLIENAANLSDEQLAEKQAIALKEPLLLGNLMAEDAKTVGLSVTVNLPEDDGTAIPKLAKEVRALKDEFLAKHPDYQIALSGIVMLNNAFVEASQADLMTLVPLMYGLLIFMAILMLRSFYGALSTLVIIALSGVVAMSIGGFVGIPLSPVSVGAPTIIMTLAIADSIHILVTMMTHYRENGNKNEAIIESLRVNTIPVTLTSLTTMIGFLSLNFSDAPPYWHLGNLTAFGILAAWLLSLLLLPALLAILPLKAVTKQHAYEKRWMGSLADWVNEKKRQIIVAGAILVAVLLSAVPSIELSDEFIKYFGEGIQFRQDAEFTAENLSGIYVLEYSIDSGVEQGVNNPEYLNHLQSFAAFLKQQPEVKHVYSYDQIIKRLNKNMHGEDEAFYKVPESTELAAQYLLLYEFSLPFGMSLDNRVSLGKDKSRVTVIIDNISSKKTNDLINRVDAWQQDNLPKVMHSQATGTTVMFSHISKRNIESMISGNILAVLLISLIIMLVLRSFSLGFISLFANTLPVLVMFGIWALLVGKVGMVASTVAASTLGIVVDDTVHFLTKYQRAIKELGYSKLEAVRYTFETVGVAIISTTVVLVVGFGVLVFSEFQLNLQTGLMSALTIIIALLFDLLLLPAILLLGADKKIATDKNKEAEAKKA